MKQLLLCVIAALFVGVCATALNHAYTQVPASVSTPVQTQDKQQDKPITLTEAEVKTSVTLFNKMKATEKDFDVSVAATQVAPLTCNDALAAVGNQKLAGERVIVSRQAFSENWGNLQEKYKCEKCDYGPGLKTLVRPKVPTAEPAK